MRKILLSVILLFTISFFTGAQDANNISQELKSDAKERPSVALVLAGGGARGFSHIAVIEIFEELGIPIDMVIGTSAGALVGGLYSAGYSSSEIGDILLYQDWPRLFQDSAPRPLENGLGSHSADANILNVQLKGDFSLDIGRGLLSGQYIYDELKAATVKIPSYIHFDSLITPFRATSVDLLTGELVVMEKGDLIEAIRSSMSIPAVFEPFPVDGRLYMDGFTRNNLPIQVAADLGYDIIIAVEITDRLTDDAEEFNSNPLTALNQVIALQQNVVVAKEYELADLILYPDIYEFGQMDYNLAPKIYEKGKKEVERYRDELLEIRSQIYPDFEEKTEHILTENIGESTSSAYSFMFVSEEKILPYKRERSYHDLPDMTISNIVLKNVLSADELMLTEAFDRIKDKPLGQEEIDFLLKKAYTTGNYIIVQARTDKRNGKNVLELEFFQKERKVVHIGAIGTFEGSLSDSVTWGLNLATSVQFRDLNEMGGIISLQGSFFNTTGFEFLYMQPVSQKVFLQTKANIFNTTDIVSSGFTPVEVSGSQFQNAMVGFGTGIFFSKEHKMLNELALNWVNATQSHTDKIDNASQFRDLKPMYTFDIASRYVFDTLNYSMFPTSGFYNDLNVKGVMPLASTSSPIIFDVLSTNYVIALPFSSNVSMVINGFIGTNVSEGLAHEAELMRNYGFSMYDRVFFPHVMQRYNYGIHKIALRFDFQFQPQSQLTILGGQLFAGFGAAVGDVWDDYIALSTLTTLDWQASAFTGLRITDSIGFILRAGAGSIETKITPYVSLDFMVKHF